MAHHSQSIPRAFVWRRMHSLLGLWLVIYLIIHLLANSQAALFVGDNGSGFVRAANSIRDLPYLQVIEIVLLAIPFGVHMIWGVQYLLTAKYNSYPTDGSMPSLTEYPRNYAYTWERITAWLLLFLITFHVIHMRFMEKPVSAQLGTQEHYMVRVNSDNGLYTLSDRLGVTLLTEQQIAQQRQSLPPQQSPSLTPEGLKRTQYDNEMRRYVAALESRPLSKGQLMAVAPNFGTAELLMVRDTFKNPAMIFLYTVLVLSACFHAFNGLWTVLITWGVTLSPKSQNRMRKLSTFLMILIAFLGLSAIWGTYWINLRQ